MRLSDLFRRSGITAAVLLTVGLGVTFLLSSRDLFRQLEAIDQSRNIEFQVMEMLSHLKDAETGQRGYIITGEDKFLLPYWQALRVLDGDMKDLDSLITDPEQRARLTRLRPLVDAKLEELAATLRLRQEGKEQEAVARVKRGYGREVMQSVRKLTAEIKHAEEERITALRARQSAAFQTTQAAALAGSFAALSLIVFLVISTRTATGDRQATLVQIRRFSRLFTAALLSIAALCILGQAMVQYTLAEASGDASVVNVAGRQRMLSQRIAKCAITLLSPDAPADGRDALRELRTATEELRHAHSVLRNQEAESPLVVRNSGPITRSFDRIEPHLDAILRSSDQILRADPGPDGLPRPADIRQPTQTILASESQFLDGMQEIVKQYETDSVERLVTARTVELAVLVALLAALVLEGLLVFRPAVRSLEKAYADLAGVSARLQAVLDAATELAVISTDIVGEVTLFNRGAEKTSGFPASEMLGKSVTTMFVGPGEKAIAFRDLIGGELASDPLEVEAVVRRKDGARFPAHVITTPVRNQDGEVAGYLLIARDVTSDRTAEETMRRARQAAESANRAKSEFLANMSHELRTPLNSVIGFANILLKNKPGNLTANDLTYLGRIRENGTHLLGLINAILDLSKVEAGRMELQREPLDLSALARETLAQLESQVGDKPVRLEANIPADLAKFDTDAGKLKQIVINLVSNALRFTELGSVRIVVSAGLDGSPRYLDVRDTGLGIPPEKQQLVFEAFRQADSGHTRKYGGTGLGLTISRSLCELMGYRLTLHESIVGKGSCFRVDFRPTAPPLETGGELASPEVFSGPRSIAKQAETGPISVMLPDPGSGRSKILTGRLRGLVIDDDPDAREVLSGLLEDLGLEATTAPDGTSGLELARNQRPDLILLDLMMPGMSGWDVLKRVHEDEQIRGIPVVIVSIVARDSRSSLTGAAEFVDKPATREDLERALQKVFPVSAGKLLVVEEGTTLTSALTGLEPGSEACCSARPESALQTLGEFRPDAVVVDARGGSPAAKEFLAKLRSVEPRPGVPIVIISDAESPTPLTEGGLPTEVIMLVLPAHAPAETVLRAILPRLLRKGP